jgi:hypothetical protein
VSSAAGNLAAIQVDKTMTGVGAVLSIHWTKIR